MSVDGPGTRRQQVLADRREGSRGSGPLERVDGQGRGRKLYPTLTAPSAPVLCKSSARGSPGGRGRNPRRPPGMNPELASVLASGHVFPVGTVANASL